MKIRDLIIAVLVVGLLASTGTLVVFASSGIGDIKNSTAEASSDELVGIAHANLSTAASSIRNTIDRQMQAQYEMVRTWAKDPTIINVAREAAGYSLEELFDRWSDPATRPDTPGEVPGDGNPENDLDPAVSAYLANLSHNTSFAELFVTDLRGYIVAANGVTEDFDQGENDWRLFNQGSTTKFQQYLAMPGGEPWFKACMESESGQYISDVSWNQAVEAWVIEIVNQLRDPDTGELVGILKGSFDYRSYIEDLVYVESLDFYEIKVTDNEGRILATSLTDHTKVNNVKFMLGQYPYFNEALENKASGPAVDENGETVYAGLAVSRDINGHIVIVSIQDDEVEAPIGAFVGQLQSNITDRSSSLRTTMIIVGAVVTLAIIVTAFFVMRAKVAIPLKKLTAVSDSLSRGEIDGLTIDIEGKDEISSFGESFKGVLAAFNFLKDEAEKKQ